MQVISNEHKYKFTNPNYIPGIQLLLLHLVPLPTSPARMAILASETGTCDNIGLLCSKSWAYLICGK